MATLQMLTLFKVKIASVSVFKELLLYFTNVCAFLYIFIKIKCKIIGDYSRWFALRHYQRWLSIFPPALPSIIMTNTDHQLMCSGVLLLQADEMAHHGRGLGMVHRWQRIEIHQRSPPTAPMPLFLLHKLLIGTPFRWELIYSLHLIPTLRKQS